MQKNDQTPGFTLVELIIVMALLAVVAAIAVPSLSGSLRQRSLNEEASRVLALTEYGRDEAVSQGVPMTIWINPQSQRFGVEPKAGFDGDESRSKDFALNPDLHFEIERSATRNGLIDAVEFSPDGAVASSSVDAMRLVDRFNSAVTIARTADGWAYEIVKEAR